VGGDQPQGARAQAQGPARRRHVVLGADAQEPGRQAARAPARARPGHPEDPRRLQGWRHAQDDQKTEEEDVVVSRIFPTTHFGFRKITVERPLRLNFQPSPERIPRLEEERAFQALAQSKKKGAAGSTEQAEGRAEQEAIRKLVRSLPDTLFKDRDAFERALDSAAKKAGVKLAAPVKKAILSALAERNEEAATCRDGEGNPEADAALRDTESVPLTESVEAFFEREVKPHVPDAWIDTERRDPKVGQVGLVGYEINFNRYFYRYTPPRPLEEIEGDIRRSRRTSCGCWRRSREGRAGRCEA